MLIKRVSAAWPSKCSKTKTSFLLFLNDDFKVLWKEYISHVKKHETILQNFWLSQKSNCSI